MLEKRIYNNVSKENCLQSPLEILTCKCFKIVITMEDFYCKALASLSNSKNAAVRENVPNTRTICAICHHQSADIRTLKANNFLWTWWTRWRPALAVGKTADSLLQSVQYDLMVFFENNKINLNLSHAVSKQSKWVIQYLWEQSWHFTLFYLLL